ncbi:MAG: hypothetical protein ACI85O_001221 [Saprospiraceae bacterium]|jgi:hypothetical protein
MKRTFTQMLSLAIVLFGLQSMSAQDQTFTITAPESVAGTYEFGQADWTGTLAVGENLTGDLVLVESNAILDDTYPDDVPTDACVGLLNPDAIAGNLALVDRGTCFFSDKVWYAQEAGAIAVIICNNQPGAGVINLGEGGDFAGLDTIPVGMLNFEDCAAIKEVIAAGGTVSSEISVQEFINVTTANNYQTPQMHIRPIDNLTATIFNNTEDSVDVSLSWLVTDPNGIETTLTTTGQVDNTGLIFGIDEPYLPTVQGDYTIEATNSLTDDVLTTGFIITDNVFSHDVGGDMIGFGPSNTAFVDTYGERADIGMLFYTADVESTVTSFEFGLANWTEINTGAAASVDFTIVLFEAPLDADGNVPAIMNGDTYDLYGDPVLFNIYSVDGTEVDGETVNVPFPSAFDLTPNTAYYIFLQYSGVDVANGVGPQYLASGNPRHSEGNETPLILDDFYSGWTSSPGYVLRTYVDFGSDVKDELAADAVAISPNPATSQLNVALNLDNVSSDVSAHIIDVTGRTVSYNSYENLSTANMSIDVSNFATGTYFIQVTTDEGFSVKKFVKK